MTSILGCCCCGCVGLGARAGACACTGPCSDVVASSNPAAIAAKRADPKSGALICDLHSKYENCCSCAGALHHDFDAAVFRAAVRRVVRGDRMRVAEALAEITLALTPCDSKYATTLSARREDKSMLLAMPARCRPDRLVLGIAVDDDLGVLQTLPPASARRRAAAIQFRQKQRSLNFPPRGPDRLAPRSARVRRPRPTSAGGRRFRPRTSSGSRRRKRRGRRRRARS